MTAPARWALVKSGVVENVILADEGFIAEIRPDYDAVVASDTAGPGHLYDGKKFKPGPAPEPTQEELDRERVAELAEKPSLTPSETNEAIKIVLRSIAGR